MSEHRGCELPEDLYYDLDYVWVRPEENGIYTIGLTDPSQTMSGKVQYVWIKDIGVHREWKKPLARIESGKWAGGIPAPFAGVIVARNELVLANPNLLNIDPYKDAWLVQMRPDEPATALAHLTTGTAAQEALKVWIDRYDVQCMRCQQ
jgi:glycine cleavage system H protein